MGSILTVLRFGWCYLRRYWVRLAFAVLSGIVFALANGSFIWATRTLGERFKAQTEEKVAEKIPSAARSFTEKVQAQLKELNQSLNHN